MADEPIVPRLGLENSGINQNKKEDKELAAVAADLQWAKRGLMGRHLGQPERVVFLLVCRSVGGVARCAKSLVTLLARIAGQRLVLYRV